MEISQEYIDFVKNRTNISKQFVDGKRIVKPTNFVVPIEIVERNLCDWKSSDFIRFITFDITGMYEYNAQNNIVILGNYLNEFTLMGNKRFVKSTWANGIGYFYRSNKSRFVYSFVPDHRPNSNGFLSEFDEWK